MSICSPFVIHWISKVFILSIHVLFLLYLLLWFFFFFFGSTSPQCTDAVQIRRASPLVTKPMHSGGPEVDAMHRGLDAKGGKVLHVH